MNLHPLPGVTVTLKDRSGVVKTTATGPGGEYLFSCVDDGRYEVEFSLEGFFTSKVEVEYFYPSSLNVDQVLPLGLNFPAAHLRLTIKIVNARTGLPVEGASILFDGREAMSDPCGRAWWSNLEGDAVQIRVRKKGFVDLERKIPLTGQTWFWTLPLAPSP